MKTCYDAARIVQLAGLLHVEWHYVVVLLTSLRTGLLLVQPLGRDDDSLDWLR